MTAILAAISPTIVQHAMANTSKSPDPCSVQQAATKALQTKSLTVERLHGSIFRAYRLQPPADYFYMLKSRPSSRIRLLRQEEDRLRIEASTLQSLRGRSDILIPRLIEYNTSSSTIGSAYLIAGPFRGSVLADIESSLPDEAVSDIERSVGRYLRQLSHVHGPAFGPVRQSGSSTSSWSKCFAGMMEGILRDAEDALISLPYEFIRDQVRRHRQILDQISKPKLVLLEMRSDKNIVVDLQSCSVSGVLDFSTAIWGDPFISDWFYLASWSFADGFGKLPNRTTEERIRQYLYTLYHALVAVVRHCYRPSDDGDEMTARRNLTSALGALTQLSGLAKA